MMAPAQIVVEQELNHNMDLNDTLKLLFMCCHPSLTTSSAIAAVHDEAACAEDTDWPQILALYELLTRVSPGPMVTLSHAVAAAMVQGRSQDLALLKPLECDSRMAEHYRLHAVRAHLLERQGDREAAITHYRIAASRTASIPEQNYLLAKAAQLGQS
jgi:predicted RNA polymerase sigma factor